jgi:hypothetical protein
MNMESTVLNQLIFDFFSYIFYPHSPISQLINNIIFIITGGLLVWIIAQYSRISLAYRTLIRFKKSLLGNKDNSKTHAEIEKLISGKGKKLLKKRISIVRNLREDANGTLDAIDHLDSDLRWETTGILKYPTSSLVIFGLLGTVWGLQKAVYSLLPTLQKELDLLKLQEVMQGTLAGMQTAFTTTLTGLFCSLVIGFIASVFLKTW